MDLLDQMQTFVRVVDANNMSAAARTMRLSLPAVSRQLRALEEDTGVLLLRRTTRRMALTNEGRLFYERAVRILREVEDTRAMLSPSRKVRGTLVVSAPISLAMTLVLPKLATLIAAHPHLTIDLRLEDRLVDFVREGVDVAIRGGALPPDSTAYVAQPLIRFARWLCASPGYLGAHAAPKAPEELVRHACLLQTGAAGPMTTWRLLRAEQPSTLREVRVTGPILSNAPLALAQLARDGAGIALVASWLVTADLASGQLKRVLRGWQSEDVSAWAVYRVEQRRSPAIAALVQALSS